MYDAVVTDTPARAATSASVALRRLMRLSCMRAALLVTTLGVTKLRPRGRWTIRTRSLTAVRVTVMILLNPFSCDF